MMFYLGLYISIFFHLLVFRFSFYRDDAFCLLFLFTMLYLFTRVLEGCFSVLPVS